MGIQNLLPFVDKACRKGNVAEFRGQTVAVDSSCWLHKGIFGCCLQLAKNESSKLYIHYCMKFIKTLLSHKIHVILVFDGQSLPAKRQINEERRERRRRNKAKAAELLEEGRDSEARQLLEKATEVTFEIVREVILAFRKLKNVDCIVAPYEADAQLAFLCKSGIAQLAITEDSDLIPFACDKIMFKMDHGGNGTLYEKSKLHLCLNQKADKFEFWKFRRSCILSGCDYLTQGLHGIGLTKATVFFSKITKDGDLKRMLGKIPWYLNNQKFKVSEEFKESFVQAENTFLFQLAFDPRSRSILPLNPYPETEEESTSTDSTEMSQNLRRRNSSDFPYAGEIVRDSLAYQMAVGNVHPFTKQRLDSYSPSKELGPWSIWNSQFKPGIAQKSPRKFSPSKKLLTHALQIQRLSPKKSNNSGFRRFPKLTRGVGSPRKISYSSHGSLEAEINTIYGLPKKENNGGNSSQCSSDSKSDMFRKLDEEIVSKSKSPYFTSSSCSPATRNPFKKHRIVSDDVAETSHIFSQDSDEKQPDVRSCAGASPDKSVPALDEQFEGPLTENTKEFEVPSLSQNSLTSEETDWDSFKTEVTESQPESGICPLNEGKETVVSMTESDDGAKICSQDAEEVIFLEESPPLKKNKIEERPNFISSLKEPVGIMTGGRVSGLTKNRNSAKKSVGGSQDSMRQTKLTEMFQKFQCEGVSGAEVARGAKF